MSVNSAFDEYQRGIDADPADVRLARERRDVFKKVLKPLDDVAEVWSSGSLRRGTQLRPIHDLDLVVVFDAAAHPTWGGAGASAQEALDLVRDSVRDLLGMSSPHELVRLASPRNHAVKCFIDEPNSGFTVDVMPALRDGERLVIPETASSCWVLADPEFLIRAVEEKQKAWSYHRPLVRLLKNWRLDAAAAIGNKVKSLLIEVLALHYLPGGLPRAQALERFFESAALAVSQPVCDPAGVCGEIQPDLNYLGFQAQLDRAARLATQAVLCDQLGDVANAQRLWRDVFGEDFPAPAGAVTVGAGVVGAVPQRVKDSPQG